MKTEILIVTYLKDKPYLIHNLASIAKFARGFSGVTVVVPEEEKDFFRELTVEKVKSYARTTDPARWQIHAQAQKCRADIYCPEADFILHTDSDCIFTEPVTPDDYFVDGKPVMYIEAFSRLPGNPWKPTVDKALGIDAAYETMRRHPQVNPVEIYNPMRQRIASVNGMSFEDYVLMQKPTFPWGFSEHCTIGAFAKEFYPELYHWVDLAVTPPEKNKLTQFWSHSPPDQEQDSPTGGPRIRPIDVINSALR